MTLARSMLAFSMVTVLCASATYAQTNATFVFTSSNAVSPSSPTTTVGIWATWDDPNQGFVFGGANYDMAAGDGLFSNPVNVLQPFNALGTSAGTTVGNMVLGARNAQLHIPAGIGIYGNPDNPLLLATYDWTTTDFSPREVGLVTSNTSNFIVADIVTGATTELFPHAFTPGSGVIIVVPGPSAWLVLPLVMAGARRRRRHEARGTEEEGRHEGLGTRHWALERLASSCFVWHAHALGAGVSSIRTTIAFSQAKNMPARSAWAWHTGDGLGTPVNT